ncbi:hypothetical protein Scep_016357 [Stephania cephalantha]|uniref:ENTH domain-containing protein n=1 Tax=Stephania cephalantha TaxID=152367 RepID=A0AAP0IMG8_9MAGN
MNRRFRQAYTALKEHSYMIYAKISKLEGHCDLDLIVIKATSPDDLPLSEKYIYELLKLLSFSPSSQRAFVLSFTRRFGKTQCWRVAIKCLLLLHRLLRLFPENSGFKTDLVWSRSNGLISLAPCRFRDSSSSFSDDYTAFIHSYAYFLDETLMNCPSLDRDNEQTSYSGSFSEKMKQLGQVLELLPQFQGLIERALECYPTGPAARHHLIRCATQLILRDSFIYYTAFRRDIALLLDNLLQMQYRCCISAFGIYKRAATQTNRLSEFYEACKAMHLCGVYEYPLVDRIPQIHVRALESFLDGMWQLTETSSSATETTPSPSSTRSDWRLMSMEDDDEEDKYLVPLLKAGVCAKHWERFDQYEEEEKQPLLQLEMDSWESLLEVSVSTTCASHHSAIFSGLSFDKEFNKMEEREKWSEESNESKAMPIYNPFYQPNYIISGNYGHHAFEAMYQ